jgi:hypothetical protein
MLVKEAPPSSGLEMLPAQPRMVPPTLMKLEVIMIGDAAATRALKTPDTTVR